MGVELPEPKVSFVIGGAQKSGTTALYKYLAKHPDIHLSARKEPHFFDQEDPAFFLSPDYSVYHKFFDPEGPHQLLGEATPIYMYWYEAPRRIWQYNPQMKWIIVLRNPVERAFSHWNMVRNKGIERNGKSNLYPTKTGSTPISIAVFTQIKSDGYGIFLPRNKLFSLDPKI